MLFLLLILALLGGVIVQLVRTYILRIKEPSLSELWLELEQQSWFVELMNDPVAAKLIKSYKDHGILQDPHYVQRLISHQGTVDGFVEYIKQKKKSVPSS